MHTKLSTFQDGTSCIVSSRTHKHLGALVIPSVADTQMRKDIPDELASPRCVAHDESGRVQEQGGVGQEWVRLGCAPGP